MALTNLLLRKCAFPVFAQTPSVSAYLPSAYCFTASTSVTPPFLPSAQPMSTAFSRRAKALGVAGGASNSLALEEEEEVRAHVRSGDAA